MHARSRCIPSHTPQDPLALEAAGSRHAPPHVARLEQDTYDGTKSQWAERLLEILHQVQALMG